MLFSGSVNGLDEPAKSIVTLVVWILLGFSILTQSVFWTIDKITKYKKDKGENK
jgi:hypothetical protein